MKKWERELYNEIIDAVGQEILRRSVDNLNSIDFAVKSPILASEMNSPHPYDKTHLPRWTIANTGITAKTGKFTLRKSRRQGEVVFDCPWSYALNFGAGPHYTSFGNIYEWAFKRRKEIIRDIVELPTPSAREDPRFWKMYHDYHKDLSQSEKAKVRTRAQKLRYGKVVNYAANRNFELLIFTFAYMVWRNIQKRGTAPTFFVSDAVIQTQLAGVEIIRQAIKNVEGARIVSRTEFS